jgi:c-di-GMP-binding flagellar brake protein YcgR
LEVIVKTLADMHPGGVPIAQVADVQLSGGGISFMSPRHFAVGDKLRLKVVLPPFTPIDTTAQVIRSMPAKDRTGHEIATEFVGLSPNDQEALIRHVLQTQAERLRARRGREALSAREA